MPRRADLTATDPALPVEQFRLEWAFRRSRLSQAELARAVTRRLKARNRYRPGRFPAGVTEAAIAWWRTGKRRTCRTSVLTALADVLGVPVGFLRSDDVLDHIPVKVDIPGVGRVRLELNWSGWVGRADAKGRVEGSWDSAADGQEGPRLLAALWTDLAWWRSVLLENYDPEDEEEDDVEYDERGDARVKGTRASLDFFEHMTAALVILLGPLGRDAWLKDDVLREMREWPQKPRPPSRDNQAGT